MDWSRVHVFWGDERCVPPIIINAARHVTFIIAGRGKAERLREVLVGPYQPDVLPVQIIRPTHGHLLWLVDAAAAIRLREREHNATRR